MVARQDPESVRGHHRRLALALEASGRADPEVLGAHFRGAGEAEKAGRYFAAAAARAADALAFDRAAKLYRTGARAASGRRDLRSGGSGWRWATPWPTRAAAPRRRGPTSRPPRAPPSPRG